MDRQAVTTVLLVAVLLALLVALLVALLAALASRRARRRLDAELSTSRDDVTVLRDQVEALTRQLAPGDRAADGTGASRPAPREFVITSIPTAVPVPDTQPPVPHPPDTSALTAGQFATVAVGESLVRLLTLGHGVRRALSAETRHRIRFAMRQEVKRSRRQRRRDLKAARRQLRQEQDAA